MWELLAELLKVVVRVADHFKKTEGEKIYERMQKILGEVRKEDRHAVSGRLDLILERMRHKNRIHKGR